MPHRRKSHLDADHDMMRCVVDDKGTLVFVTPALGWCLGQSAKALTGLEVKKVISVTASLDHQNQSLDLSGIGSGFYEVALLREGRDPILVQARIDIVAGAEGRAYSVIWLDPENKLKRKKGADVEQAAREFAAVITDNIKNEERVDVAPVVASEGISKADSELRHFLNLTSDLLGVYTRDMSFVRVNPAFNRLLGFSDGELRAFPFIDLVHPEERDRVRVEMQKVLDAPAANELRIDFQCRTRCKDGNYRWIEWVHKASGDYVYLVGTDVTDAKFQETELKRREQQLSEAQKIGRMGHWLWETHADIMEWSDQIYSIFGVEKDAVTPLIDNVTALILKRDMGRVFRAYRRALVRKKDYEIEFRLRRPTGGIRYVRCEGRCKLDPMTGEVAALFGIMQDITERTLHENALKEAKEAAETAYASKTRFLANMSHELRTPLNAIIGFSEMMQRQLLGPVGNNRYLDYIGGIRQSGEHLLDLINDILDMSKIEIGKYELHVEELNIGKVIRLAIHMVEGRAHDEQVRLIADDIPEDTHVTADRRAIMQILLNLLSNAVKFTKPGGTIDVRCVPDLGGIAMIVSDTGIGIPKDKLALVTMPFEQVSSEYTRNHEGSGLGLAITKDLIEMHGGTLDITSEVGVGTTVTVTLPQKLPDTKNIRKIEEFSSPTGSVKEKVFAE